MRLAAVTISKALFQQLSAALADPDQDGGGWPCLFLPNSSRTVAS
jgi:hypothetical protein